MNLTWTCMICSDDRPDERISVAHQDVTMNGALVVGAQRNVRYCNDRLACARKALAMGSLELNSGKSL